MTENISGFETVSSASLSLTSQCNMTRCVPLRVSQFLILLSLCPVFLNCTFALLILRVVFLLTQHGKAHNF